MYVPPDCEQSGATCTARPAGGGANAFRVMAVSRTRCATHASDGCHRSAARHRTRPSRWPLGITRPLQPPGPPAARMGLAGSPAPAWGSPLSGDDAVSPHRGYGRQAGMSDSLSFSREVTEAPRAKTHRLPPPRGSVDPGYPMGRKTGMSVARRAEAGMKWGGIFAKVLELLRRGREFVHGIGCIGHGANLPPCGGDVCAADRGGYGCV